MGDGRFEIDVRPYARAGTDALRAFDRRKVESAIASLAHDANVVHRNRKPLPGVTTGFEFEEPLWELRVGDYRVFYDVDEKRRIVRVHAVKYKPPGKTTQEVLA